MYFAAPFCTFLELLRKVFLTFQLKVLTVFLNVSSVKSRAVLDGELMQRSRTGDASGVTQVRDGRKTQRHRT